MLCCKCGKPIEDWDDGVTRVLSKEGIYLPICKKCAEEK